MRNERRAKRATTLAAQKAAHVGDQLRAVRELLRELGRPARLRQDPIISRFVAEEKRDIDPQILSPAVEELLRATIHGLPARARIVLERIELEGQSVSKVACALGLSVRQVYRDRALALRLIAQRLALLPQPARLTITVSPVTDVRLAHAIMLAQIGQLTTASDALGDISSNAPDPHERIRADCALIRLALEQGSSTQARSFAQRAMTRALALESDGLARYEVESTLGELALRYGRADAASQMLKRSATMVRRFLGGLQHDYAAEVLARALIARSIAHTAAGQLDDAWDTISEARERLHELSRPTYLFQLGARVQMAATAHFIDEHPDRAEAELRACYDIAVNGGFTLSALNIAVYLATFYRLRGATDLALDLMHPLAAICEHVSRCRSKAVFYGSFATLLSSVGQTKLSAEMLSRARRATLPDQPDLDAQWHLVSARANIAAGVPLAAIEDSAKAQVLFAELGRTGLIGVSLHLRSLALAAVGRHREALHSAREAVDALALGHPQARALASETAMSVRNGRVRADSQRA